MGGLKPNKIIALSQFFQGVKLGWNNITFSSFFLSQPNTNRMLTEYQETYFPKEDYKKYQSKSIKNICFILKE